jgi:hypothetical protein
VRFVSGSGQVRYRLGDRLVDRYLEFVAGRCRPNTLRAVAFDLKAFFTVISKDPVAVTAADVSEFLAHQRGDRTVGLYLGGAPGTREPNPAQKQDWPVTCWSSVRQAARVYSLISPSRTGFRRICCVFMPVTVA